MREQANCPICGRRLFDYEEEGTFRIESKCSKCKNVILVKLESGRLTYKVITNTVMRNEQKGA